MQRVCTCAAGGEERGGVVGLPFSGVSLVSEPDAWPLDAHGGNGDVIRTALLQRK